MAASSAAKWAIGLAIGVATVVLPIAGKILIDAGAASNSLDTLIVSVDRLTGEVTSLRAEASGTRELASVLSAQFAGADARFQGDMSEARKRLDSLEAWRLQMLEGLSFERRATSDQ